MIKEWEELNAKATRGPLTADFSDAIRLRDSGGGSVVIFGHLLGRHGLSGRRDTNEVEANAKLLVLLRNHSEALLELVKAAQKHVVKRSLDDDHPLREALAKLEGK